MFLANNLDQIVSLYDINQTIYVFWGQPVSFNNNNVLTVDSNLKFVYYIQKIK
jgi:hypothetical protein